MSNNETIRLSVFEHFLKLTLKGLKCPYSKKWEINSNKLFTVAKYLIIFIWKYLLTKYLGTLFNQMLLVIAVNF